MSELQIRAELATRCAKRGGQTMIAEHIGVGKSTVSRWLEGMEITTAHQKLLRLYFFGEIPFDSIRTEDDLTLRSALVLSQDEWGVIKVLANRNGIAPRQWIADRIREHLAIHHPLRAIAEDPADFQVEKKNGG